MPRSYLDYSSFDQALQLGSRLYSEAVDRNQRQNEERQRQQSAIDSQQRAYDLQLRNTLAERESAAQDAARKIALAKPAAAREFVWGNRAAAAETNLKQNEASLNEYLSENPKSGTFYYDKDTRSWAKSQLKLVRDARTNISKLAPDFDQPVSQFPDELLPQLDDSHVPQYSQEYLDDLQHQQRMQTLQESNLATGVAQKQAQVRKLQSEVTAGGLSKQELAEHRKAIATAVGQIDALSPYAQYASADGGIIYSGPSAAKLIGRDLGKERYLIRPNERQYFVQRSEGKGSNGQNQYDEVPYPINSETGARMTKGDMLGLENKSAVAMPGFVAALTNPDVLTSMLGDKDLAQFAASYAKVHFGHVGVSPSGYDGLEFKQRLVADAQDYAGHPANIGAVGLLRAIGQPYIPERPTTDPAQAQPAQAAPAQTQPAQEDDDQ